MQNGIGERKEVIDDVAVFRTYGIAEAGGKIVIAVIYGELLFERCPVAGDGILDVFRGGVTGDE